MKKSLPIFLALCLGTATLADHTVTMRTTMEDPAAAGMKMTSVTRTKNKRQRTEDTSEMSGFKMNMVRLTMCDLEQEAQIDPDLKIYTVRSLNPMAALSDPANPGKTTKGTGKVVTNVKVQDMGVEKVAQVDARHWIVDTATKTTGCLGNYDTKVKREFWTSALPSFACPVLSGVWTKYEADGCQATNEMTGDSAKYMESLKHQVVKEIFYVNGKKSMTREMVDFSTAALDDSLFSLDGYKKVTDEEFQAAQQKKMMEMYAPK